MRWLFSKLGRRRTWHLAAKAYARAPSNKHAARNSDLYLATLCRGGGTNALLYLLAQLNNLCL